ncbi:MAG: hypothetical protein WD793_10480 [Steroidobacteraceae bacterium]
MDSVWKGVTLLVAAFAAWIGLQQWWINREKLRLDLFARRHAIFDSTRKFIAYVVREGRVDLVAQQEFWAGTVDASFLFHADVVSYIEEIHQKSVKLHYHAQMQGSGVSDREAHIDGEMTLLLWFAVQLRDHGIAAVFGRYLRFQDLQGPLALLTQRVREKTNARKARQSAPTKEDGTK